MNLRSKLGDPLTALERVALLLEEAQIQGQRSPGQEEMQVMIPFPFKLITAAVKEFEEMFHA